MRAIVPAFLMCFALLACDTENSAKLKPDLADALGNFAFDDQFAGEPAPSTLLQVLSNMAGTSADGRTVDLVLTYILDPYVQQTLRTGAYLQFDYVAEGLPPRLVAKVPIAAELRGVGEVSVPTTDPNAKLVATIGGLIPDVIDDSGTLVVQLPAVGQRETTDLSLVTGLFAELVDGSYQSSLVDGRRVHEFAIRVIDPTAGPLADTLNGVNVPAEIAYSVTGLEKDVSSHFSARENGIEDIESPVSVSFTEHPLAVYMVIDASKSLVESRQSHHLLNAVSNTVIALSENAQFDYRTFNGDVSRISDLRELDFDSADASATALYYALDTALSDIEDFGSIEQDKVVMVFTDGKDLASRNHYDNDFIDNAQVHEYIVQRVDQVRRSQQTTLDRQFQVYAIGFYDNSGTIDVTDEVRKLDAIAEVGGTQTSYNNFNADDIESAFSAVVQNVKGVYYLQYSSQQTASNNKLELIVKVNGHEARVLLPSQNTD